MQTRVMEPRAAHPTAAVDRHSPMPLFEQIKQDLRRRIETGLRDGSLRAGDFFTTEQEICQRYEVSGITAKRVLNDLESEGQLSRQRGRGTFIAQRRISQSLDHFYRFTQQMREQGWQPDFRHLRLAVETPEPHIAEPLGLTAREKVIAVERLRFINDEPYFLQTSYLPLRLFPGMEKEDLTHRSLYDWMEERYRLRPVRCRDIFEPILLHKREAGLLQVAPRSVGMLVERIAYSSDGKVVEVSRGVIRGDRCRLTVDLH